MGEAQLGERKESAGDLGGEHSHSDVIADSEHVRGPRRFVEEADLAEDLARVLAQQLRAVLEANRRLSALQRVALVASGAVGDDQLA